MNIRLDWSRPIDLEKAGRGSVAYRVDEEKLSDDPGIYVFGRQWGDSFEALYVGKANRLRIRLRQQLNNLNLNEHLRNAKTGRRVVFIGRLLPRPGQQLEKTLKVAERGLIRHFLSEGHDLVNTQGTRIRRHEINAEGRHPRGFLPKQMYVERRSGE